VQVRIVSATHKDLALEVQAGRFRQDLFYRLNVIKVGVPPLRERLEDLPAICSALLRRIAQDAGAESVPYLSASAQDALRRQHFAGNVRELENLLHRAVALSSSDELTAADLGLDAVAAADGAAPDGLPSEGASADVAPLSAAHAEVSGASSSAPVSLALAIAEAPLPSDLQVFLDDIERELLHRALQKYRYNRTAAGESLGLTLRQMRYRMARLGVLSDKDGD